jgi:hypothetical protein
MTRLQAEVDKQRTPDTAIPLRQVLVEWLRTTPGLPANGETGPGPAHREADG